MDEIDQAKINAVCKYLSDEFPKSSYAIKPLYDEDLFSNKFIIDRGGKDSTLIITKKCWDDKDTDTLIEHLKNQDIDKSLRKNPGKSIKVNKSINWTFGP
jgi:hypothetical protein